MAEMEMGHEFLARLGKTRLRPGGKEATDWLFSHVEFTLETKVLEVACNMGTNMVALAKEKGCHIIGLDMNAAALEKAKANIAAAGVDHLVETVEGNALELPFADDSFDIVINEAMLTMLPSAKKPVAVSEYYRVLKPGGLLLTHDVCVLSDKEEDAKAVWSGISNAINAHVEPLTLKSWQGLFEEAGFHTAVKHGGMTLLDPIGMAKDEGVEGMMKIMTNALKPENVNRFRKMFTFFHENSTKLNYIAVVSRKGEPVQDDNLQDNAGNERDYEMLRERGY